MKKQKLLKEWEKYRGGKLHKLMVTKVENKMKREGYSVVKNKSIPINYDWRKRRIVDVYAEKSSNKIIFECESLRLSGGAFEYPILGHINVLVLPPPVGSYNEIWSLINGKIVKFYPKRS